MSESLNFKSSLLYLYWLMSGADNNKQFDADDPEWRTMRLMRQHENITNADFDNFINTDFGSKEEQLRQAMKVIKTCTRDEQIKALAWMGAVMVADGIVHKGEDDLYQKVRRDLSIEQEEVDKIKSKLPKL
jgi:uncharacterized tellurite resistance protein B-like protein